MGRSQKVSSFSVRAGIFQARIRRNDGSYARRSTGIDAKNPQVKNKLTEWLAANLNSIQTETTHEKDTKFAEFAAGFYDPSHPSFSLHHNVDKDYKQSSLDTDASFLKNHILPYFQGYKLSEINVVKIEQWLKEIRSKLSRFGSPLSRTTIHHCFRVLRFILKEAKRLGIIAENPAEKVLKPTKERKQRKEILTPEEFYKLFLSDDALETVWSGNKRNYVACYMGSIYGLRMSEILGIQRKYIFEDRIEIKQQYYRKYRITTLKTNASNRTILLFSDILILLKELLEDNPYGNDPNVFLFWGEKIDKPMSYSSLGKELQKVLANIGIDHNAQKERKLSFHTLRNLANTYLLSLGTAPELIRAMMGQSDEKMTDYYAQFRPEYLEPIKNVMNTFINDIKKNKGKN